MKRILFVGLIAFACGSGDPSPQPVDREEEVELKQYGTPFGGVVDARDVVIYEVNIRAFSAAGNLQGVIDRLDHIKELGINTIWLMPIHPVGQVRSAGGLGSPYSVKNYLEVSSEFGTLEKLRELVTEAHNRNMSVILDWVANHTSWDNVWMKNKSWYTTDSNGNIIIPPGTNWQDVAELNYSNSEMRKAMIHAMKYWVLEANVDGFRCDAVDFVPKEFWKQALDELKKIPNRKLILLAEGSAADNFASGFQMNYAWDFYTTVTQVYKDGKSVNTIFATHEAEYNAIPSGAIKLRYTTNHDQSAWEHTPVEVLGGRDAALSASVITIFTSAAPLLYSSQEVGRLERLAFFTRDPIDWDENQDMHQQYEKLFAVYNSSGTFRNGALKYYPNNDVAVFTRKSGSEEYLVLVNTRNANKTVTLDAAFNGVNWTNEVADQDVTTGAEINLAPFEFLILKKL